MQKGSLPSQSEQMHMFALARQRRACTIAVVDTVYSNSRQPVKASIHRAFPLVFS
jgi:hypothetical protein